MINRSFSLRIPLTQHGRFIEVKRENGQLSLEVGCKINSYQNIDRSETVLLTKEEVTELVNVFTEIRDAK